MPADGPAGRLLIVDDQVSNVRLLEFMLRRAGYAGVESTTEPKQVEAMYLENRYDLILLDLQMPGMSGFEVMKRLRGIEGSPPVTILVISADPGLMVSALEGGANSFLSKPYRLGDVLDRVQILLTEAGVRNVE